MVKIKTSQRNPKEQKYIHNIKKYIEERESFNKNKEKSSEVLCDIHPLI